MFQTSKRVHLRHAGGNRIALLMAVLGLTTVEFLNAQLCTTADSTHTPCVLTAGYAGPATDANFNKRQAANTSTPNLIYLLFGAGAPENDYTQPYAGWAVAYKNTSSGLSPVFAYSDEPSSCGTGGGASNPTPQCNVNPNSGSPACDCYWNNTPRIRQTGVDMAPAAGCPAMDRRRRWRTP
jgi:hypothetical protein